MTCVTWASKLPFWKFSVSFITRHGRNFEIIPALADVIGDIFLVAVPIRLFWNLKISRFMRVRLITVFSMSLLTTVVSLVQNYYQIHNVGSANAVASTVQVGLTHQL
jgi:hypothetical protein